MLQKFRKTQLRFRSDFLKYLLRLMGMVGFGMLVSCTKYGAPIAEYGIMIDDFVNFHGTVLSEDSLNPLGNIKVQLTLQPDDTIFMATDLQGNYSLPHYAQAGETGSLIFTDTDSIQNGSFLKKNVAVEVSFKDMNNLEHETDVQLERKP